MHLYVLRCGNLRYVGITENLERRLGEHRSGAGSAWTKSWDSERIILQETIRCDTETEALAKETQRTAELSYIYDLDKIRGAQFCMVKPTKQQKRDWIMTCAHVLGLDYDQVMAHMLPPTLDSGGPSSSLQLLKSPPRHNTCKHCGRSDHKSSKCSSHPKKPPAETALAANGTFVLIETLDPANNTIAKILGFSQDKYTVVIEATGQQVVLQRHQIYTVPWVEIHGLVARPELNGDYGLLVGSNSPSSRLEDFCYHVQLGEKTLMLKPANVILPEHCSVLLVGLEGSHSHFNDRVGVIAAVERESERFVLRVPSTGQRETLRLKWSNVRYNWDHR